MTSAQVLSLLLSVWAQLGAHPSPAVAQAFAAAVERDPFEYADTELDAGLLAYYAARESNVQRAPRPQSWDAKAGRVCSYFQMACADVAGLDARAQAALFLRHLHSEGLDYLSPSPAAASWRLREVKKLLGRAGGDRLPGN